ncbi:MAG: M48 family metalloprotease [Nitrospinae bacterium]|nr:M48 family metalloprotease [Nitrospinota bacterium]
MKKIHYVLASAVLVLAFSAPSYSISLGDIFKEVEKQTQPPKPEPPAQLSPKTPEPPPAPSPQAPAEQPAQDGGLIGLGESLGVLDKKTSKILRQTTQAVQALQPIGYEEEKTIGGALAAQVFAKFGGPYNNPQLQKYVTMVGQSVAQFSDRPDIPYHFAIVNADVPNAFAAPGGYVFVSLGLLRLTQNEAQLAGILGHEIAHVGKKHALQTIQRSKTLQGVSALTLSVMDKDPAMFNKVIDEVSDILFTHGLDKEMEFEADQFGTEYAYRVGYYPGGLNDFIKILAGTGSQQSIFFSTHPSPRDRYARLKVLLEKYQSAALNPVLANRYKTETKGTL